MDDDLLLNFAPPDPYFKPKAAGPKVPWRERRIEKLKANGQGVNFSRIDKTKDRLGRAKVENVNKEGRGENRERGKKRDSGLDGLKNKAQKMLDLVNVPKKTKPSVKVSEKDPKKGEKGEKDKERRGEKDKQRSGEKDKERSGEKGNGQNGASLARFPESGGDKGGTKSSYVSSLFTHRPETSLAQTQTSQTVTHKPSNAPLNDDSTFDDMGLDLKLASHLKTMGYNAPTKIQRHVCPHMINQTQNASSNPHFDPDFDSDLFVKAQTGSGKTLAFCLPILSRLMAENLVRTSGLFAIILTPTRELASQIHSVLEQLLRCHHHLVPGIVVGGEKKKSEKARIRKGVNILVATPGRLADHLENTESLDISQVRWLVMDEADRLVDLGFQETITKITDQLAQRSAVSRTAAKYPSLPGKRINILCSATMPENVKQMGSTILDNPKMIAIDDKKTAGSSSDSLACAPDQLVQNIMVVPPKLRLVTLAANLKKVNKDKSQSICRTMVFFSCSDSVDYHYDVFSRQGKVVGKEGEEEESSSSESEEEEEEGSDSKGSESGGSDLEEEKKGKKQTRERKGKREEKKPKEKKVPNTTPGFREVRESNTKPCISTAPLIDDNTVVFRMHGSLTQQLRTSTIRKFANNESNQGKHLVLLCTDVASRGLDLPNIAEVIEYDPPFSLDDHLHRIGRSARVGNKGSAYLYLLPGQEEGYVDGKLRAVHPKSENVRVLDYESLLEQSFAQEEPEKKKRKSEKIDPNAKPGKWDVHATTWHLEVERWLLEDAHALSKASDAFISHIRAYATHLSVEKMYFNVKLLHLGHLAKSFGLRETPKKLGRSNTSSEAEKRKEDPRKKMLRMARSMEKAASGEFNY